MRREEGEMQSGTGNNFDREDRVSGTRSADPGDVALLTAFRPDLEVRVWRELDRLPPHAAVFPLFSSSYLCHTARPRVAHPSHML